MITNGVWMQHECSGKSGVECFGSLRYIVCFFTFQAEDGLRDVAVTGVQTCALPIYSVDRLTQPAKNVLSAIAGADAGAAIGKLHTLLRQEPFDTIAARRRIADAITEANRYPL